MMREYLTVRDVQEVDEEERRDELVVSLVSDMHSRNLRLLERKAQTIQYMLACLSTLGGAHHLCNKPEAALQLALQQEYVGRRLGSTQVVIRAQVFQAVNHALLGNLAKSRAQFKLLEAAAREADFSNMLGFVRACRQWVRHEVGHAKSRGALLIGGEEGGLSSTGGS